jgi:phthalate 3,4-dioxygenase ferredoxin reductase component
MSGTVAVVGSSVAGVRTAQALRTEEHDGPVVLIGAEAGLPYDKPPLSKQFLAGTWGADRITLLTEAAARAAGIELRLGVPAQHLDVAGREVLLADGHRVSYDHVVIATGSAARPSPWPVASGVHVLRTLDDSRALRADLERPGPVVVVGGGFIGAEVAATARASGHAVTVVDPLPAPIGRLLGPEIGELMGQVHRRHGVETRFGVGAQDITGEAGNLMVTLTDGRQIEAATVVVGIGAIPATGWLAESGVLVDNGVVCDEYCRALEHDDVWAVGDVARWDHPRLGEAVRVEHWTNAVEQAACVAFNLTHPGQLRGYAPTEYVWSDQYDWKIQIVGQPRAAVKHRFIGGPGAEPPRFAVVYSDEDSRLAGAVAVNWPKALVACRRLLTAGASSDEAARLVETLLVPAVA